MMNFEAEMFDGYSINEIKQGYYEDQKGYSCLICGKRFEKGEIYRFSERLYEGKEAIKLHIQCKHHSVKNVLLGIDSSNLGISALQLQLLNYFAEGMSDKEIAERLEVSSSTIRNHRHKLKERERQNKVFISLMELLREKGAGMRSGLQADKNGEEDRVSDRERKRILDRYMTVTGRIKSYPEHEIYKRVILEAILINFYTNKKYTEDEVNAILMGIYKDYKLLRNELIAYGYLDRTNTGAIYWVKGEDHNIEYLSQIAK